MAKSRKSIDSNVLRLLYAHSGNKCAFSDCMNPIFEDDGILTGERCHIEAYSPGGPRYNHSTSPEEKNKYENLILLCARHHIIIDGNVSEYTTEHIKSIKANHEKEFLHEQRKLSNEMITKLQAETEIYYSNLERIDDSDKTDMKFKMDFDMNIWDVYSALENLINGVFSVWDGFRISDESIMSDVKLVFDKIGVDVSLIEKIPYYENPFSNRNWDMHSIGYPNHKMQIELCMYLLKIKILEKILEYESSNQDLKDRITEERFNFEQLYRNVYYAD